MKKTFYITTPIFYPSGELHIGHVYSTTIAWALANHKRAMGYDVKFLTGADEHGQKIQQKALEMGLKPQEYVDQVSQKFIDLWDKLDIDYDYFSRTTGESHMEAVKKQFEYLLEKDLIYKGEYKGLYSVQDEEFLTPTQANEVDGKFFHPESGHQLEEVSEESYFLRMSKFQEWWTEMTSENNNFITPNRIVKELRNNFVDKGLEDLSITRTSFDWGIKIDKDPKHVVYVWLDALNNYITALGYNSNDDSDFVKYWINGDEIVHVVGKEITRFHGIYWPIILKANNIKLPTRILSHGWIVTPEGKMSKSKGNVVNPINLLEKYDAEVIKYFFGAKLKSSQDSVFDEVMLKDAYNADLANNYGNLLSRTIAMYEQNFTQPINFNAPELEEDKKIVEDIKKHSDNFINAANNYELAEAFEEFTKLGKKLNGFIDVTMPWTLKEDKKRLSQVLNLLFNGLYSMTFMMNTLMPKKANIALKQLNIDVLSPELLTDFSKFNSAIPKKENVLFERIK